MGKRVVVALGGNAILTDDPSAAGQKKALDDTAKYLIELIKEGYELIISHGNGPQVGNLLLQQEAANSKENPAMPLDTCVAMTQGSIGYWLTNSLNKALKTANLENDVVAVITQVLVDEKDPAFKNPTKPIGPFLTKEEADKEHEKTGSKFKEDAGRGYRKVVASPKPISIIEHPVISSLVDKGVITIAVGGGGIPVEGANLQGVEAVIDKDFASEKLAELVEADSLIILTGVTNVSVNFGKPSQEELGEVSVSDLQNYKAEGHFAAGSMLPKVEAAIEFVESGSNREAIITSLENLPRLFEKGAATIIRK